MTLPPHRVTLLLRLGLALDGGAAATPWLAEDRSTLDYFVAGLALWAAILLVASVVAPRLPALALEPAVPLAAVALAASAVTAGLDDGDGPTRASGVLCALGGLVVALALLARETPGRRDGP